MSAMRGDDNRPMLVRVQTPAEITERYAMLTNVEFSSSLSAYSPKDP